MKSDEKVIKSKKKKYTKYYRSLVSNIRNKPNNIYPYIIRFSDNIIRLIYDRYKLNTIKLNAILFS